MLDQVEKRTNQLLTPYLPSFLVDWASASPDDRAREIDATVAFVDISGFTKLSERLAKRGKVGAEELADAINACFTRLLAVAYSHGGVLIKCPLLVRLEVNLDHRQIWRQASEFTDLADSDRVAIPRIEGSFDVDFEPGPLVGVRVLGHP